MTPSNTSGAGTSDSNSGPVAPPISVFVIWYFNCFFIDLLWKWPLRQCVCMCMCIVLHGRRVCRHHCWESWLRCVWNSRWTSEPQSTSHQVQLFNLWDDWITVVGWHAGLQHVPLQVHSQTIHAVSGMLALHTSLVMPMTHALETGTINRLHFLAPVFGASFSYHVHLEWKFMAPIIKLSKWFCLFSAMYCTGQTIKILIY